MLSYAKCKENNTMMKWSLKKGKLASQSEVYQLEPYLGDDELLSVSSQLKEAFICEQSMCPILLSRDHPVTKIIV